MRPSSCSITPYFLLAEHKKSVIKKKVTTLPWVELAKSSGWPTVGGSVLVEPQPYENPNEGILYHIPGASPGAKE